jgi:hypothetical protein
MGMVVYEEVGAAATARVKYKWRRRGHVSGGEKKSRGEVTLVVGEFDQR